MIHQSHSWAYNWRKTIIRKDTCTAVFISALFTIAKTWKQPKCPLTEEWIKKMWYIYTMEYYSAIKRNEIGSFVEMWMDLETVIQSEVSKKQEKQVSYINAYMWNLQKLVQTILFTKQKQRHRRREQTYGYQGGKGGCKLGDWD